MKVYIGADHGGYELKEKLKPWLAQLGFEVDDKGPHAMDPADDFPDFAFPVAEAVAQDEAAGKAARGVLICRSSAGVTIAANKVKGIRAAALTDEWAADHARTNDDVNVGCLAGDRIDEAGAKAALKIFLETDFPGGERFQRRIDKISQYELEN